MTVLAYAEPLEGKTGTGYVIPQFTGVFANKQSG